MHETVREHLLSRIVSKVLIMTDVKTFSRNGREGRKGLLPRNTRTTRKVTPIDANLPIRPIRRFNSLTFHRLPPLYDHKIGPIQQLYLKPHVAPAVAEAMAGVESYAEQALSPCRYRC